MTDDRFDSVRAAGGERYRAFLEAGYRECYSPGGVMMTPFLLQKPIVRGGVREYFVNVWVHDFREFRPGIPVSFQPECQFNSHGHQSPTFDVTLLAGDMGPAEIEAFFRSVYDRMGCEPYGE